MVAAARARWDGRPLAVRHGASEFVVITGENVAEQSEAQNEVELVIFFLGPAGGRVHFAGHRPELRPGGPWLVGWITRWGFAF